MSETGVLRLLNPLNVRFSQPRVAPHFRDGHLLEPTAAEVRTSALEDESALQRCAEYTAADGTPPYDVVLIPPFPAIRVISWMPKIRGADGEAERDANGDQMLGKRAWFALDNRRLWSLQKAAAQLWPKRCCAVVRCLEDVPGTTIKELRKFRTTTEGKSVEFGIRTGETTSWSWLQAAPAGATWSEDTLEGLFGEDLWDAKQWAPQATASATARDPEDFLPRNASAEARKEAERAASTKNGYATANPSAAVVPTPNFAGVKGGLPIAGQGGRKGEYAACPDQGWQYMDPKGKVQGPFDRQKMRLWHEHGFFYPELLMRSCPEDAFVPFSVLFPAPAEPFLGYVMRYRLK